MLRTVCLLTVACCYPAAMNRADAVELARTVEGDVAWYDVQDLGVEGQGWSDTKAPFDRLPSKAEGVVRPPVWSLSRHSSGLCVRFQTSSTTINARWKLTSSSLAMPHMAATGVSGVDLYVKVGDRWRWLATGRPSKQENTATLVRGLPAGLREYILYLPLYNGVTSVELGVPKTSSIAAATARPKSHSKPMVFWGTSITQGGCASRTGMVHTAILGRWFNRPVINLGFSGNGRMEPEVATLISEIDASVFVIDCCPNLDGQRVAERIGPVVEILRKARPDTPILLVEDRTYSNAFLVASSAERNAGNRAALQSAYKKLTAEGVKNLHYLEGDKLLGEDGEDTVDGSHPTDLGFLRHAQAFREPLGKILGATKSE